MVELFCGKHKVVIVSTDPERLDKGEQAKCMHATEGIRPPEFLVQGAGVGDEDVEEMGNSSKVP